MFSIRKRYKSLSIVYIYRGMSSSVYCSCSRNYFFARRNEFITSSGTDMFKFKINYYFIRASLSKLTNLRNSPLIYNVAQVHYLCSDMESLKYFPYFKLNLIALFHEVRVFVPTFLDRYLRVDLREVGNTSMHC